ncbi:MAG: hypothetical protein ACKVZ0_18065 [Gemmatimonadales bacterium]
MQPVPPRALAQTILDLHARFFVTVSQANSGVHPELAAGFQADRKY